MYDAVFLANEMRKDSAGPIGIPWPTELPGFSNEKQSDVHLKRRVGLSAPLLKMEIVRSLRRCREIIDYGRVTCLSVLLRCYLTDAYTPSSPIVPHVKR